MDPNEKLRIRLDQLMDQPSPEGPYLAVELTRGPQVPPGEDAPRRAIVREWTGAERKLMAAEGVPPVQRLGGMIAACTVSLGDVKDRKQIEAWVRGMTATDRTLLFFGVRRATLSPQYPYVAECPNSNCKHKDLQEVDLGAFDVLYPTRSEWQVTVTLSTRQEAVIVPMTGREDELIAKYDAQHRESLGNLARLRRVGERDLTLREGMSYRDIRPLLDVVEKLPGADLDLIQSVARELEGGVDTRAEMECPECGRAFEEELSIGEGFFSPLAVRSRWKKKSSG